MAETMLPQAGAAEKFQEPTKEELGMTSDPKAPGAPAVYLYQKLAISDQQQNVLTSGAGPAGN